MYPGNNYDFGNPQYFFTHTGQFDSGDRRYIQNIMSLNNINTMSSDLKSQRKRNIRIPIDRQIASPPEKAFSKPWESNYVGGKNTKVVNVEDKTAQTPESKQIAQPQPEQTPIPLMQTDVKSKDKGGFKVRKIIKEYSDKPLSESVLKKRRDFADNDNMKYLLIAGGIIILAVVLNKK